MYQCPSQQDIMDLHAHGLDIDFPHSSKELSRWVAQIEYKMKGKDEMISELRGPVDVLADAVAQRGMHVQRHKAKSEDQGDKEEQERLCAREAALEVELVACGRPPLKPKLALPSTSGYQPQQGQKGLSRRHGHGKTANSQGGKF